MPFWMPRPRVTAWPEQQILQPSARFAHMDDLWHSPAATTRLVGGTRRSRFRRNGGIEEEAAL
jgi:hypothetical protein